jgi:hypothetical protein
MGRMMNTKLSDSVMESINWNKYNLISGSAANFDEKLRSFIWESDESKRKSLWFEMENNIFAQEDLSTSAEPVIQVLYASLLDGLDSLNFGWVIELLSFISRLAFEDDSPTSLRCQNVLHGGVWLIIGFYNNSTGFEKDSLEELLSFFPDDWLLGCHKISRYKDLDGS